MIYLYFCVVFIVVDVVIVILFFMRKGVCVCCGGRGRIGWFRDWEFNLVCTFVCFLFFVVLLF